MGLFFICLIFFASLNVLAFDFEQTITKPRFARGDVNGDGIDEVIVGGRVGPFRRVTDPVLASQARVEVYIQNGWLLELLWRSPELHVVKDVAAGDLDGDGHAEVVAVGSGRIMLLGLRGDRLEVTQVVDLPSQWTDRIEAEDLDGDGRAEVIATLYQIESESELGSTEVVNYRWRAGSLEASEILKVPKHVGDLVVGDVDGDNRPELLLETGLGEEGGEVIVYRSSWGHWNEAHRATATEGRVRALNLSLLPGNPGLLGVGSTSGQIWYFDADHRELRYRGSGREGVGLTGLLFLKGRHSDTRLLTGVTGRLGSGPEIRSSLFGF